MGPLLRSASMLAAATLLAGAQQDRPSGPPGLVRGPVLESTTVLPGQPRSEGEIVLDAPRPVGTPVLAESQLLAADAVVASETMELPALYFQLAAPVALGPPFNSLTPAGTDVKRLMRDGAPRNCIRHRGSYTPAFDEHGEVYPGLCLEDRDGDGLYETAILEPYNPQRAQVRTVAIAPVRLDPNPSGAAADPSALRVNRRLRVAQVGASEVRIVAEQGITMSRQGEMGQYYSRPQDSLTLPLRDGANGSLGGVRLRLLRDGAGWRIAAAGHLAPWLEVRDNGYLVVAGGMEFRRRHSSDR